MALCRPALYAESHTPETPHWERTRLTAIGHAPVTLFQEPTSQWLVSGCATGAPNCCHHLVATCLREGKEISAVFFPAASLDLPGAIALTQTSALWYYAH